MINRWHHWGMVPYAVRRTAARPGGRRRRHGVGRVHALHGALLGQLPVRAGAPRVVDQVEASHSGKVAGGHAFARQVGRFVATSDSYECTHVNAECNPDDPTMQCCTAGYECVNQN